MLPLVEKTKEIFTQMYWSLSKKRSFYIGDEYRIDLIEINRKNGNAKILVTNLKVQSKENNESQEMLGM